MFSLFDVPEKLRTRVERELEPHETIQWAHMPIPKFFTISSTSAFLFSIPWTAFAIFWICGAAGFKIPDFSSPECIFPLFGLPFVLIGLGLMSTPYWTYRKARMSIYIITNTRAITFEGGRTTTIRSYLPKDLQYIYRQEKDNGVGDVIISHRTWRDSDGDKRTEDLGFMNIPDTKEVERLLKKLAAQATPCAPDTDSNNQDNPDA